jgi:hypothetical protein
MGNVVLGNSLSHLGTRGLYYTEGSVRYLASIGASVGQGTKMVLLGHVHLGRTGDAG